MFGSVLVVCIGNICRSPTGERALAARLPGLRIGSAGPGALVGFPADDDTAAAAAAAGLSLDGHSARQFTAALGGDYDLILAMEPRHRSEIMRIAPHLSGRTMLFDQWTGAQGIADPYRRPAAAHQAAVEAILKGADAWAARLSPKAS
ncbi:MAG TPA: low molecular weight phosphotyrosine protein phosphatase [Paracoccaceae bacterium]|nr:low molecular weight phosphotyrosine protein phosphatase [Paracoccaceae bacterium]